MSGETKHKKCPSCGNPDCLEDDSYCFNCGAIINNCCINEKCVLNDDEVNADLPDDFCYCPECGEETYFKKQGYIAPKTFPNA